MPVKIHYIQPFDVNKNIGRAINAAILQLNTDDKDWICLTDSDVIWLLSDSKSQLEYILANTDYNVLGALTNRLGLNYQLVHDMFNEDSISKHIEVAKSQQKQFYEVIEPIREILAAFCLCFTVGTWRKLGMFKEKSIQFDSIFCAMAINRGMKLGIMKGIYLLHLYRWGSINPKTDYLHLLVQKDPDSDLQ